MTASAGRLVVVAGSTGYLGREVVKCAHAHGLRVRALVRTESRLGDARQACDEVFVGEATQPETLAGLCDGADVLFSSLGNRTLARTPDCFAVDYRANMNILDEAREAGVRHVVFVSVLSGHRSRARVPQIEARERVVDALRKGPLAWTIVRPSGFFNDMAELLAMARRGRVWIPGGGARFNPIHGADLAEVCVAAMGNADLFGREVPAGGPDCLTMRDVGELAFRVLGRSPRISTLPLWLLTAAGRAVLPFNLNVASIILMMGAFGGGDWCCDVSGEHRLEAFFRDMTGKKLGDLAVRR